jgi:hypothetical protein
MESPVIASARERRDVVGRRRERSSGSSRSVLVRRVGRLVYVNARIDRVQLRLRMSTSALERHFLAPSPNSFNRCPPYPETAEFDAGVPPVRRSSTG